MPMWHGPERRSRGSKIARALVAMKKEADEANAERSALPRWRRRRREELRDTVDDLRSQEHELLTELGGRPRDTE
jgi:hypothetical protein